MAVLVYLACDYIKFDKLSSEYFPGVWVLKADVSEHCVSSIFNRWWSVSEDWLVFSPYLYGKRIPLPLPRPHLWLTQTTFQLILFPYKYGLKTSQASLTLQHLLKMEPTQCSETSAFNTQTLGKCPEDNLSRVSVTNISGMIMSVPFIASLNSVNISHKNPASAGRGRYSCYDPGARQEKHPYLIR